MPKEVLHRRTLSQQFPALDLESLGYQLNRVSFSQLISHNETVKKVFDGREIHPALLSGNIGNIRHPFLIGFGRKEFPLELVGIVMQCFDLTHLGYGFCFLATDRIPVLFISRRMTL
jgi:hypothetical protein